MLHIHTYTVCISSFGSRDKQDVAFLSPFAEHTLGKKDLMCFNIDILFNFMPKKSYKEKHLKVPLLSYFKGS